MPSLLWTTLCNTLPVSNRRIAGLGIKLPVVLNLRVLKVGLLLVCNPVVKFIQLIPTLDRLLIIFCQGKRHATYKRTLCGLWGE